MTEAPPKPQPIYPTAKAPNMATVTSTETEETPAMSPSALDSRPIRRAVTVGEGPQQAQLRRRSVNPQSNPETTFGEFRRRSSTFSDYSLDAARRNLQHDILNPASFASDEHGASESSMMPLAFALLPAIAGMFHNKGSDFITDIILLALAAIFLHWSLTVPWNMYKSAQQVRVENEQVAESALDEDETSPTVTAFPTTSDEVEEPRTPIESKHTTSTSEESARLDGPEIPIAAQHKFQSPRHARRVHKALGELYTIELLALALCFVSPLMMAYLLQIMRNQFKSEGGLVSDFSLTLYILAAEVRPVSHLIKLIQARTLHLQRIVHQNPYAELAVTPTKLQNILDRLGELEQHATGSKSSNGSANPDNNGQSDGSEGGQDQQNLNPKVRDGMVREVRNTIQPDLDALNRAVRRYEKKATVLAYQTEARLGALDGRLNDAIALAAAAAKAGGTGARPHGNHSRATGATGSRFSVLGMLALTLDTIVWAALMPFQALLGFIVLFPLRAVAGFLKGVTGGSSRGRVAAGKLSGTDNVGGARKGINGNGYATGPGNTTGYPLYASGGAEYGYSASGRRMTSGSGGGARYSRR